MRNTYLDDKVLQNYLGRLVNHVYKILPLREQNEATLKKYMSSLQVELLGCDGLIVALHCDAEFLSLLSILQYFIDRPDETVEVYRREIFKALSICNKLRERYARKPARKG